MKVADLVGAMEATAPARFAAAWDNVGLLVGDPEAALERVLLTVDCTSEVLAEAARRTCEAIVSYHPPIFDAQKRFIAGSIAYEAARRGIAIHSPHTALDVADGGTNDVLADLLEMSDRAPLRAIEAPDMELKLVTFVPVERVEALSRAVFAAGAGRIGKYSSCSFRVAGTGTFFGEEGTRPAVGEAGRMEETPEIRVEAVVPVSLVGDVVRAMRTAHPYEEPAFDLVRVAAPPSGRGFGRVGSVPRATIGAWIERIKSALGVSHVLTSGDPGHEVTRAAVCAGSGGDFVGDAVKAAAQLLLTGEVRHHDALRARAAGLAIVCTRHSTSERTALAMLGRRLSELLPGVTIDQSNEDRDPFVFL